MTITLAANSYGKSAVRLMKVERRGAHHTIRDLTVDVSLEGDFVPAHTEGTNADVLPTDTMKNTVYAKAREGELGAPEDFATALALHFIEASPLAFVARVNVAEHAWQRMQIGGTGHTHAFEHGSAEARTARVELQRGGQTTITAGIDDLLILKSAQSAFSGYPRDKYTTLKETEDRILATSATVRWKYPFNASMDYNAAFTAVRQALLGTFADHDSKSVQHTLYAMGEAALSRVEAVQEISITMPNKHHLLADLSPFGLDNPNEIFVPTLEPYGLISATLRRDAE